MPKLEPANYKLSASFSKEAWRLLAPVTLNSDKSIRIEAKISNCSNAYGSMGEDLSGGILFAAKDEKNGYGLIRSYLQSFKLVKFVKGKPEMISIFEAAPKAEKFDLEMKLESWQWMFFVNGELVYMCDPKPWIGDKAGLFVEHGTFTDFDKLVVSEGEKRTCPYTPEFTDEELGKVLEAAYCDAKNSFDSFTGAPSIEKDDGRYWLIPAGLVLKGQIISFVYSGQDVLRNGKRVLFRLPCPVPGDKETATIQYEILKRKLDNIHRRSLCGPNHVLERKASEQIPQIPRAVFWVKTFNTDRYPKVTTLGTELYVEKFENKYQLVIFVYMTGD